MENKIDKELFKPFLELKENIPFEAIPEELRPSFEKFIFGSTCPTVNGVIHFYAHDVRLWAERNYYGLKEPRFLL